MPTAVQRREATPHPHTANPSGSELLITAVALHKLLITPGVAELPEGRCRSLPLAIGSAQDLVQAALTLTHHFTCCKGDRTNHYLQHQVGA